MTPALDAAPLEIELPRGTQVCEDTLRAAIAEMQRVARKMRYWPRETERDFRLLAVLVLRCVGLNKDTAADVATQVWAAVRAEHRA